MTATTTRAIRCDRDGCPEAVAGMEGESYVELRARARDERAQADWLANRLGDDRIDRRVKRDTWHRGDWMQTFTGRQFYPMSPHPADVDIVDIAHALSMLCRYNGHVTRFYSVAEHCVLMSRAADPDAALWCLLHDATEAYVGDMVRPLKLSMPEYRAAEDRVEEAIAARFNLGPKPPQVKLLDTAILLSERNVLLAEPPRPWSTPGEPLDIVIEAWSPAEAEHQYLSRFAELCTEVPA